jgi:hypothetical protein
MCFEKGFSLVVTKAVLFFFLISGISVAQENTAPPTADAEGSAPTEVPLADTLDFIKRNLSEPRREDGGIECSDNRPVLDWPSTTWKAIAFAADGNQLTITEEYSHPAARQVTAFTATDKSTFRLDLLVSTGVSVEKGTREGACTSSNATWFVRIRAQKSASIEHTTVFNSADFQWCQTMKTNNASFAWDGEKCVQRTSPDILSFAFDDKQLANRVAKAFVHAIILASPQAKPDVF